MLSHRIRTPFVALSLLALVAALGRVALATNEYGPANCTAVNGANCGSCLEGIFTAAQCTQTGTACIIYQGTAGTALFKCCVASGVSGVFCQAIPGPTPYPVCGNGTYWTCGCRNLANGDCSFTTLCTCVAGGAGGYPMISFTQNATC